MTASRPTASDIAARANVGFRSNCGSDQRVVPKPAPSFTADRIQTTRASALERTARVGRVPGVKKSASNGASSAAENEHFGSMAPLPASSFELRSNAFRLRITKAEVSEKTPSFWHVQHLVDAARSQNRDPTHSYAVGACCEPHRMDRGDDRVFGHLRHRLAPETVSDFGSRLSKDRHLAGSLFESGQLELRILSRQIVAIRVSASALQDLKSSRTARRRAGSSTMANRHG
jgi:hypothetical protein